MGYKNKYTRQQGAVSLFVVIFTALLFAAVTIGFTVLMLSDQQQATDNDLAQSALDSAHAGTEDAKRVLAEYADCQERGTVSGRCATIATAIGANKCSTVSDALGTGETSERKVQQSEGDSSAALQQAYTCVKITPDTDTYVGKTRNEGDIRLIPLKTTGAYDTVVIHWLTTDDIDLPRGATPEFTPLADFTDIDSSERANYLRLPSKEQWRNEHRGAILRVGSIQYKPGEVNLNTIDDAARAVFLYSSNVGVTTENPVDMESNDLHRPLTNPNQEGLDGKLANYPVEVRCNAAPNEHGTLCSTSITLPQAADASLFRYLTITSLYRDTNFAVELKSGGYSGSTVKFKNVQPEIDVTGRANNVFRRLVSRVESADASESTYPRAAMGVKGDLCKDFVITDDPEDYMSAQQNSPSSPPPCPVLVY